MAVLKLNNGIPETIIDYWVIVAKEFPCLNVTINKTFNKKEDAEDFLRSNSNIFRDCIVLNSKEFSRNYYTRFPFLLVVSPGSRVKLYNGTRGRVESIDKSNYTFKLTECSIPFSLMDIKVLNGVDLNNENHLLKFE